MKKTIALILTVAMILCIGMPVFAAGTSYHFTFIDSGKVVNGDNPIRLGGSIHNDWTKHPRGGVDTIFFYSPEPVKSVQGITSSEHCLLTGLGNYTFDQPWDPVEDASQKNPSPKSDKDLWITQFKFYGTFLNEKLQCTSPPSDVKCNEPYIETRAITLENGDTALIEFYFTIYDNTALDWNDDEEFYKTPFILNQEKSIKAYILPKDLETADSEGPYQVKWWIEEENNAEITKIEGRSGSKNENDNINGLTTNIDLRATDSQDKTGKYYASTITVKPKVTNSDFTIHCFILDKDQNEISGRTTPFRAIVNATSWTENDLEGAKNSAANGDIVVLPERTPTVNGDTLQDLIKAAAASNQETLTMAPPENTNELTMSFDTEALQNLTAQEIEEMNQRPFTASYQADTPNYVNDKNDVASQWLKFDFSGKPPADVTITLTIDQELYNSEKLVIWYYDGNGRVTLRSGTEVKKLGNNRISFVLDHFSTYAVYPEGVTPNITYSSSSSSGNKNNYNYSHSGGSSSGSSSGSGNSIFNTLTNSINSILKSKLGKTGLSSITTAVSNTATAKTIRVADAVNAANKAADQAKVSGKTKSYVRFINPAVLPKIVLDAIQKVSNQKGVELAVYTDTIVNNEIIARMYINPKAYTLSADIQTGIITNIPTIKAHFNKYFANRFAVIGFTHQGSFGTNVDVAAKSDLRGMDTSKLVLYTYDAVQNRYSMLFDQTYFIDANGYLHFTTSEGNYIIVSEGQLR